MVKLSDWEHKSFSNSSSSPDLTVVFPSREIYFSPLLLRVMRLENLTCPKTLDQWYELCSPEDHAKIYKLENIIYGHEHENFFSLTRKLYCGDGYYRNFRLEAFIQRSSDGRPIKLIGTETLALSAWLENANDGDKIECVDDSGRVKVLEAVRVAGVMTLNDLTLIEDLRRENFALRHEIQRRIFSPSPQGIKLPESDGTESFLFNVLDKNINLALDILTNNYQLKALKRSLNNTCLTVGLVGLKGSGKTALINALLGEKLIPSDAPDIPIICREGESRIIKAFYQDGRTQIINTIPKTNDIARIEITMPGALIPSDVCIVDAPSNLRNISAELDVAIYVTPIRAALKAADFENLKQILSINDELIFALSYIDLETDDKEAGHLINSAHDKILSQIASIKKDVKRVFEGREFDVVPISAKVAFDNFYDKKSEAWSNSNLDDLLKYYIEPLRKDAITHAMILRIKRALKIINQGPRNWKLRDIARNLQKVLTITGDLKKFSSGYLFNKGVIAHVAEEKNLLTSLITSLREREFKSRFFSLKAFNGKRKAIFLGADRTQSLKLFARLSHNMRIEKLPDGDVTRDEWFYSGSVMPFGCIKLSVTGNDEDILIAPSDSYIAKNFDKFPALFEEYTPVVSVDISRVNSGLADLAYSPYITLLTKFEWVLAYGNAGLFDTRQIDMVSQVPQKVKEFTEANGLKEPSWFIYENYKIF